MDIFEGPLDLLLYLIKKNHINIHDIPINTVLNQYLQFLELMRLLDLNIASEYMVMTATLIQIKSRLLLPQPQAVEEQPQDPREELVARLLEYQRYKEIASFLKEKQSVRSKYFTRPPANIEVDGREIYFEASIFDLINAFKEAVKDVPKDVFYEVIKDEFTVEEEIHYILHLLMNKPKVSLSGLFSQARNNLEIVAIFLAILELIKLQEIAALQEGAFSDIIIVRK